MQPHARLVRVLVPVVVCAILGCAAAQKQERAGDEWAFDGKAHELSGDPDDAEARWRQEIAAKHWTDEQDMLDRDKLLTDDPPKPPSSYGKVAANSGDATDPPPPGTMWERFQSGADTFGRGTFAALTVAVTLGMMAAPYLLF